MKNKYFILFMILIVLSVGLLGFKKFYIDDKYKVIRKLNSQLEKDLERMNSAIILSFEFDEVNHIINNNLVDSADNELVVEETVELFHEIDGIMEELEINRIQGKPGYQIIHNGLIIREYNYTLKTSYKKFLQLLNRLEAQNRIIEFSKIYIRDNAYAYLNRTVHGTELENLKSTHEIQLSFKTITLLKS